MDVARMMVKRVRSRYYTNKIRTFMERHREVVLDEENLRYAIDVCKNLFDNKMAKHDRFFYDDVLFYILYRMYPSDFNDSQYFATVLILFSENCQHEYSCAFNDVLRVDDDDPDKIYKRFENFLCHTYYAKLMIEGDRLSQMKIRVDRGLWSYTEIASKWVHSRLIHLLLRYGALFSTYDTCLRFHKTDLIPNFGKFLVKVLKFCHARPISPLSQEELHKEIQRCYQLLMRDLPNWLVSFSTLSAEVEDNAEGEAEELVMFRRNTLSSYEKYLTEPMALQQICRLFVRRTLNTKWQLPDGINSLPLPRFLRKYIDV